MSVTVMSEIWKLAIETAPKMVLLKLADHANDEGGSIFPGLETIRLAVGFASDSTVKRRLRQFKALGILVEDEKAQAGRRTTGRGNYKIWRIDLDAARHHFPPIGVDVKPPNLAELARATEDEKRGCQDQEMGAVRIQMGGSQDCKGGLDIAPESSRPVNEPLSQIPDGICEPVGAPENLFDGNTSPVALPAPGRPPGTQKSEATFERFWLVYPRKVAKGRARKAWAKAITKADPETIIEGAARYAAEQRGRNSEFTKHPPTWLAGECWLDEPLPCPPGSQRQGTPSAFRAFARAAGLDPDTLD